MEANKLETIQLETLTHVTGGAAGWLGMIKEGLGMKNDQSSGLGDMLGGGGGGLGMNKEGKPKGLSEFIGGGISKFIGGPGLQPVEGK